VEINRASLAVLKHERNLQNDGIYTEHTFLTTLHLYASFDILTYSVAPFKIFVRHPIKRLIYSVGTPPMATELSVQLTHTHAKLWICYNTRPNTPPDVYVGSANATDMTLLDLLIKANYRQSKVLVEYFDLLWKSNYKKP
jgi:hypothetical protein